MEPHEDAPLMDREWLHCAVDFLLGAGTVLAAFWGTRWRKGRVWLIRAPWGS